MSEILLSYFSEYYSEIYGELFIIMNNYSPRSKTISLLFYDLFIFHIPLCLLEIHILFSTKCFSFSIWFFIKYLFTLYNFQKIRFLLVTAFPSLLYFFGLLQLGEIHYQTPNYISHWLLSFQFHLILKLQEMLYSDSSVLSSDFLIISLPYHQPKGLVLKINIMSQPYSCLILSITLFGKTWTSSMCQARR